MALPTNLKTPGVYIDEKSAFPNSVMAVETAVPVFIGYTEKSELEGKSLKSKPVYITSLEQLKQLYGGDCSATYDLQEVGAVVAPYSNAVFKIKDKAYTLSLVKGTQFNLYRSLQLFYQNGGGPCYIISVGTYTDGDAAVPFTSLQPFTDAIDALKKEATPTILVLPDAVLFERDDCYRLQEYMVNHCGVQQDKVAILDIYEGDKGLDHPNDNPITQFRNGVNSDYLSYGAAYYPWLHTTVVKAVAVDYTHLSAAGRETLATICTAALAGLPSEKKELISSYIKEVSGNPAADAGATASTETIHTTLKATLPEYQLVMEQLLQQQNLLPPSGAIAGIYTAVDAQRGVWKAPANVAVAGVVAPTVAITHEQQEDLNVPLKGKAVCAIRSFVGQGILVWGARTLDANSLDWRYINVRRTMIMIEQSLKCAAQAYVFESNTANTWVLVKSMMTNFLINIWKQGGLAGAVPNDAFIIDVGLGTTMTPEDILEGYMKIQVRVAVTHPAEFIVITFQQQMQKA